VTRSESDAPTRSPLLALAQRMHPAWRSACLNALARHLARHPACSAGPRRALSVSAVVRAANSLRMEDFPCDVIRYVCIPHTVKLVPNVPQEFFYNCSYWCVCSRSVCARALSALSRPWQIYSGRQVRESILLLVLV
jgi:hypothetical protein